MGELKSWHSPYKSLIDCSNLSVADDPSVRDSLVRTLRFFEGFFLRKAFGFSTSPNQSHRLLPFEVFGSRDAGLASVGLGPKDVRSDRDDLRSLIVIENHFQTHCVELSFAGPVAIDDKSKLDILRSKLTNNLMQWHSKWNLLIDCTDLSISSDIAEDFAKMELFFKGLFLKKTIGYGVKADSQFFPFSVYRARHKAVAFLENEGLTGGDQADCRSRKA